MAFSGGTAFCSAITTWPDLSNETPFIFTGETPIAAESVSNVLFVTGRMKMLVSRFQGSTFADEPKPNVKYASAAVIAFWWLASGTAKRYAWIGPVKSFTPAGGALVLQDWTKVAE